MYFSPEVPAVVRRSCFCVDRIHLDGFEVLIINVCLGLWVVWYPNTYVWVFPKIGVPQNGWFMMENPIRMDDLGGKPTIFGNTHIIPYIIIISSVSWLLRLLVNPEVFCRWKNVNPEWAMSTPWSPVIICFAPRCRRNDDIVLWWKEFETASIQTHRKATKASKSVKFNRCSLQKTNMSLENQFVWRCIAYWNSFFSGNMLSFGGVVFFVVHVVFFNMCLSQDDCSRVWVTQFVEGNSVHRTNHSLWPTSQLHDRPFPLCELNPTIQLVVVKSHVPKLETLQNSGNKFWSY